MPVPPEPQPLELQEVVEEAPRQQRRQLPPASPLSPATPRVTAPQPTLPPEPLLSDEPELPEPMPFREGSLYPKRRRGMGVLIGWLLLLLVLGAIVGGGWYFRDKIVAEVPELKKLYDWLGVPVAAPAQTGSLTIDDFAVLRTLTGDTRELVVTGKLTNASGEVQSVPKLEARILDESGTELMRWHFDAGVAELQPGASAAFESKHEHPDYGGRLDIEVTFAPAG